MSGALDSPVCDCSNCEDEHRRGQASGYFCAQRKNEAVTHSGGIYRAARTAGSPERSLSRRLAAGLILLTPGSYREGLHPCSGIDGLSRLPENLHRVAPAVGCIRAANAAVIAKQRLRQRFRPAEVVGHYRDAMADVGLDVEQIRRSAAPFPCVKRHHLHEAPCSDEARRSGIEPRILSEEHADQQGRSNLPAPAFLDECGSDAIYPGLIRRVLAEDCCHVRLITCFRKLSRSGAPRKLRGRRTLPQNYVEDLGYRRTLCGDDYGLERTGKNQGLRWRRR